MADAEREGSLTPEQSHARMQEMIAELKAASKFSRQEGDGNAEVITSPEGEQFTIRALRDPKDPAIKKLHSFMVKEFGKEESETLTWLRHTIKEGLNDYHIVEKDGKIVAISNTRYFDMENGEGSPKESILTVWHITTERRSRNKGLASEIYQSFYKTALDRAKENSHAFKGVVGEAVSSVEPFLNRMGRGRVYFEDASGNVKEVPYVCPPVDMDSATGEPLEDPVPEHIMVRLMNGKKEMPVQDLMRITETIYIREYLGAPDNYESPDIYGKAREYNMGLLNEMRAALGGAKDGKVFFMTAAEREQKREELSRSGKELIEMQEEGE